MNNKNIKTIEGDISRITLGSMHSDLKPKNDAFDVIREYITKDVKERSELNKGEIRALTFLHVIAEELDWEFTKNFCEHFLHLMRSNKRQGIGEDIQLLTGFLTQSRIAMSPLGYSIPASLPVSPENPLLGNQKQKGGDKHA